MSINEIKLPICKALNKKTQASTLVEGEETELMFPPRHCWADVANRAETADSRHYGAVPFRIYEGDFVSTFLFLRTTRGLIRASVFLLASAVDCKSVLRYNVT